jgi:hypothetical protein
MPIKTNVEKAEGTTPAPYVGGSSRGWSFISTGLKCWWAWFLRYVIGIVEAVRPDYFDVGSVMHALHEGRSLEDIRKEFVDPEIVKLGQRLYEIRMKHGAPLPEATAIEKTIPIMGGRMTSKPDRIEKDGARDFKSSIMFSKNDDASWGVDGGIIGEAVAADIQTVLVDITKKPSRDKDGVEREAEQPTKVVRVTVTPAKRRALELIVTEFWRKVDAAVKLKGSPPLDEVFPRNLLSCVNKYGKCAYYDRCWGSPPESLMYRQGGGTDRWTMGEKKYVAFIKRMKALFKAQKL